MTCGRVILSPKENPFKHIAHLDTCSCLSGMDDLSCLKTTDVFVLYQ